MFNIDTFFIGDITDSVTDFMVTDITSTTITLSWSPPTALIPVSYEIRRTCRRLCESLDSTETNYASVTSPHNSTGITPYTECAFNLIGVYGAENVSLTTNYLATTLFAGKVLLLQIVHYLFTQLLLHQLVISHSHQWSQCQ